MRIGDASPHYKMAAAGLNILDDEISDVIPGRTFMPRISRKCPILASAQRDSRRLRRMAISKLPHFGPPSAPPATKISRRLRLSDSYYVNNASTSRLAALSIASRHAKESMPRCAPTTLPLMGRYDNAFHDESRHALCAALLAHYTGLRHAGTLFSKAHAARQTREREVTNIRLVTSHGR